MCKRCQLEEAAYCFDATAAGQRRLHPVERALMQSPEGRRTLTDLRAATREYDRDGLDRDRARGTR